MPLYPLPASATPCQPPMPPDALTSLLASMIPNTHYSLLAPWAPRLLPAPIHPVGVLGPWTGAQCGWASSPSTTPSAPTPPISPTSPLTPLHSLPVPQFPLMPLHSLLVPIPWYPLTPYWPLSPLHPLPAPKGPLIPLHPLMPLHPCHVGVLGPWTGVQGCQAPSLPANPNALWHPTPPASPDAPYTLPAPNDTTSTPIPTTGI